MQQEADRGRSFSRRALFLGGAQVAFFGGLLGRLYHLQVSQGPQYTLLAEDNRANHWAFRPPQRPAHRSGLDKLRASAHD